jgi:glucose/arabinose dehydrogenase
MLVTERPGRLRVIRDGKLDPAPIEGLPDLVSTGISGLFGLALHPDFARNRLIYFAYPKPQPADRDVMTLAVARARWDGGASLADVKDIFVANDWYGTAMSRENNRCCGQGPASGSFGARLEFDTQNRLYITSGDRNWGEKSQDPQSHIGKIVRVNDDGSVPKDNPFVGRNGYLPEIYTLGHRNPTGLRFDPATGDLWSTEFGPAGGDELNRIEAGKNYGWLLITHGNHYNNEPKKLGSGGVEGYVDPVIWWPRGGNPGNLIVYRGSVFSAWQGNVIIATMSNRALGRSRARGHRRQRRASSRGAHVDRDRYADARRRRGARRANLCARRSLGVRVARGDSSGRAGGRTRCATEVAAAAHDLADEQCGPARDTVHSRSPALPITRSEGEYRCSPCECDRRTPSSIS